MVIVSHFWQVFYSFLQFSNFHSPLNAESDCVSCNKLKAWIGLHSKSCRVKCPILPCQNQYKVCPWRHSLVLQLPCVLVCVHLSTCLMLLLYQHQPAGYCVTSKALCVPDHVVMVLLNVTTLWSTILFQCYFNDPLPNTINLCTFQFYFNDPLPNTSSI